MNTHLYETILIALAVRAGLAGDETPLSLLWPHHTVFTFTGSVSFVEGRPDAPRVVAGDPQAWLNALRVSGVVTLGISHTTQRDERSDRMGSGFVGGGRSWALFTSDGTRHEAWWPRLMLDEEARDEMIRSHATTGKIWRSLYLRQAQPSLPDFDTDLKGAARALETALRGIAKFANEGGAKTWTDNAFDPALRLLDGTLEPPGGGQDVRPFVRSKQGARLLEAAMRAWVFGGMGSWNDAPCDPHADYERVSAALYLAIHRALAAAVNG